MSNAEHSLKTAVLVSSAADPISRGGVNPIAPHATAAVPREIAARGFEPAYSPVVVAGIVRIFEVVLLFTVGLVSYRLCAPAAADFPRYLFDVTEISLLAVVAFQTVDIYRVQAFRAYEKSCLRLSLSWSIVFLVTLGISQLASFTGFPRLWLASYYVAGLLALVTFRYALSLLVLKWTREGRFDRRTVIVGGGDQGEALITKLLEQHDSDLHLIGMFDDRGGDRSPGSCNGVPKLGKVGDLVQFARHTRVDLVIVALPVTAEERILQMLKKLWVLPLDIRLAAHGSKLQFRSRSYSYVGNVPVFDLFDRPIVHWDVVTKWTFDKIVGTAALICAAPLMLAIALAIKLDSRGPVLFRQRRYGFNNEIVDVYKFRSMYVEQADVTASKLVTRNDPRVTRVGRFIRRTSFDELPQLFNVIFTGNLSLVGPRPHAIHAKAEEQLYQEAVDGYFARHRVKPGITGWAQINGWRGETDSTEKIQRRVEHDLYYIENWSILFDLWILARTPVAMIRGESAY